MASYRIISSERLQAAACLSDHFDTKIVDIRDGLAMLQGYKHCKYIISRLKTKEIITSFDKCIFLPFMSRSGRELIEIGYF